MMLVASVYTIVFLATFSNNKIIVQIQRVMFDTQKGYGYSSALAWLYFYRRFFNSFNRFSAF